MSESYIECEFFLGTAGNQFYKGLWAQAAAQGITVLLASGDEGSAVCDFFRGSTPFPANFGLAVNGLASTPYDVAVGGTDFMNFGPNFNNQSPSPYWKTTNDSHQASALGYIPESTWNSTCTNSAFIDLGYGSSATANCNNASLLSFVNTVASSGGVSNCIASNQTNLSSCSGGYPKPNWQTGPGVPNDGARDVPDVSLFAGNGFTSSTYILLRSRFSFWQFLRPQQPLHGFSRVRWHFRFRAGLCRNHGVLVNNQFTGSSGWQGNANYALYKLPLLPSQTGLNCNSAAGPAGACIFNDVTSGTISVPCARNSPNCVTAATGYGVLSGYDAGAGYDLATGLGSVNVANLVHSWGSATFSATTTSLTLNNNQPVSVTHGQSVPVMVTVASNNGTPTGNVCSFWPASTTGKAWTSMRSAGNGTVSA